MFSKENHFLFQILTIIQIIPFFKKFIFKKLNNNTFNINGQSLFPNGIV